MLKQKILAQRAYEREMEAARREKGPWFDYKLLLMQFYIRKRIRKKVRK